ncbi:MAG: hypothetical protein HWE19_13405 [Vibrionaceae bacterium]|nr:hypothetical protein [Vibrionaceae bacterium]
MGDIVLFISVLMAVLLIPVVMGFIDAPSVERTPLENYSMFKYRAAGKNVVCKHCDGEFFRNGNVLLNSRFASFLGLDWANKGATTLECMDCGQIQIFAQETIVDKIEKA